MFENILFPNLNQTSSSELNKWPIKEGGVYLKASKGAGEV